jgi:hypothetical protein
MDRVNPLLMVDISRERAAGDDVPEPSADRFLRKVYTRNFAASTQGKLELISIVPAAILSKGAGGIALNGSSDKPSARAVVPDSEHSGFDHQPVRALQVEHRLTFKPASYDGFRYRVAHTAVAIDPDHVIGVAAIERIVERDHLAKPPRSMEIEPGVVAAYEVLRERVSWVWTAARFGRPAETGRNDVIVLRQPIAQERRPAEIVGAYAAVPKRGRVFESLMADEQRSIASILDERAHKALAGRGEQFGRERRDEQHTHLGKPITS